MNLGNSTNRPAVLTSWKDIAQYMGKGVRTVQRWEQDFALPVRRPQGSNKKAILARPSDLDAWVALRCASRPPASASSAALRTLSLLPGDSSRGRGSLEALTALNAQIETSHMLRTNNLALMQDVCSALHRLRHEIKAFESGH
ncbi:MAG: hypothetical protein WBW84_03795 [Acidobacteriaceae bacterium]